MISKLAPRWVLSSSTFLKPSVAKLKIRRVLCTRTKIWVLHLYEDGSIKLWKYDNIGATSRAVYKRCKLKCSNRHPNKQIIWTLLYTRPNKNRTSTYIWNNIYKHVPYHTCIFTSSCIKVLDSKRALKKGLVLV